MLLIMQGPCAEERDRALGPALGAERCGERWPLPAEGATAKVRAVTDARAASRRGDIRLLVD
ncbi:hypothetical protein SHIRM173S_03443 [Streptomyces hirsutus]